jgi:antitoxin YefM
MKTITATEAKKKFLALIREADSTFERYLVTRNGDPKVVLMAVDDYESWIETLEILCDKKAMSEIRKARRELKAGKGIPLAAVLEELGVKL